MNYLEMIVVPALSVYALLYLWFDSTLMENLRNETKDSKLLRCAFCLSYWLAALLVVAYTFSIYLESDLAKIPLWILATVALAHHLYRTETLYKALEIDQTIIKKEELH